MELSGYFAVARRWWWTLLVAAWVAGLAGFYVASRIDKTYESQVRLLVGPINTDDATLRASGQLVQTVRPGRHDRIGPPAGAQRPEHHRPAARRCSPRTPG